MRKIFVVGMAAVWLFSFAVMAQAPLGIDASINKSSGSLTVKVDHPVNDRQHKYISRIEITVDSSAPINIDLFFQKSSVVEQTINISDLEKARKITITAYSKGGGNLKKEFDVPELLAKSAPLQNETAVSAPESVTAAAVPGSETVEK
jgi:hypothetical protein